MCEVGLVQNPECHLYYPLPCHWQVYHLASVRLRDLCERLDVDDALRSQTWTCFEHVLMEHVELLQDRHLDQIVMCSIYVMAKVMRPPGEDSLPLLPPPLPIPPLPNEDKPFNVKVGCAYLLTEMNCLYHTLWSPSDGTLAKRCYMLVCVVGLLICAVDLLEMDDVCC